MFKSYDNKINVSGLNWALKQLMSIDLMPPSDPPRWLNFIFHSLLSLFLLLLQQEHAYLPSVLHLIHYCTIFWLNWLQIRNCEIVTTESFWILNNSIVWRDVNATVNGVIQRHWIFIILYTWFIDSFISMKIYNQL